MRPARTAPVYAALPFALLLAACGRDNAAPPISQTGGMSRGEMVEELASTLQACSYDGRTEVLDPTALDTPAPDDCRSMVDRVMAFTGLPQNFIVTEAPIDNAAAVILLDRERVPQRVIAFNRDFIGNVQRATGGNAWAPISIMAHEIGHHLSGHTITGSGSRPEVELEADKFSGFVLQKMGASRADATQAILTFGTDHEMPTHPAKDRRAVAISQGWAEACRQAARPDCAQGGGTGAAPTSVPAQPPRTTPAVAMTRLPAPAADAIPFKYGRFVVDETGKLDPAQLETLGGALYDLAKAQGIELTLLVVDDLHGMTAQDYAWAMMRQLRVGKLDLGNGGVFVVAPAQGTSAVAFAPGIAKQLEFADPVKQFDRWSAETWQRYCMDADGCGISGQSLLGIVESQVRSLTSSGVQFQIRFQSIQEVLDFSAARLAERRQGREWDDARDQALGSLTRFTATVTDLAPEPEQLKVNENVVRDGRWRAIVVRTDDGKDTTLYMQPQTEALMPGGRLETGKRYSFVGELMSTGAFHTDQGVLQGNVQLWLFSYDPLG